MEKYILAEIITVDSSFDIVLVTLMVLAMATWVAEFYPAQIGSSPAYFPRSRGFYLWNTHGSPGFLDRLLHIRFCYFSPDHCFRGHGGPSAPCFIRTDQKFNDAYGAHLTPSLFIANHFQGNILSNKSQQCRAYSSSLGADPYFGAGQPDRYSAGIIQRRSNLPRLPNKPATCDPSGF